jgi:L-threonylcarbamoyladenylate synthase
MNKTELQAALAAVEPSLRIAVYAYSIPGIDAISAASVLYRAMPLQASQVAYELFAVLREFDAQGVAQIWVETLPDAADWDGVRDRLMRAAAPL